MIDLVWPRQDAPQWTLGRVLPATPTPEGLRRAVRGAAPDATHLLFWDPRWPLPAEALLRRLAARPVDAFHAGLLLGQSGRPALLGEVRPAWMLGVDPPSSIEATSWRLSLDAALVRRTLWDAHGGVDPAFGDLDLAALDLGHRAVWGGHVLRHRPDLLPPDAQPPRTRRQDPTRDDVLFLERAVGRRWTTAALALAGLRGRAPLRLLRRPRAARPAEPPAPRPPATTAGRAVPERVSVLVPTLSRHAELARVLPQVLAQTAPVHEVVVIDQTPGRDVPEALQALLDDPRVRYLRTDRAGQCRSRNQGIALTTGDAILFLDDDDEIQSDLVARHLERLAHDDADASCGGAVTAEAAPDVGEPVRVSDVFPTNNALLRKEALKGSGLFDLAYDRGARADHDLGMRLYASGALMILDPSLTVVHHHADHGGLRAHGARRITYARSRRRLGARHLLGATEMYLHLRHLPPHADRRALLLSALGTFAVRGGFWRRAAKAWWALLLLPDTVGTLLRRRAIAKRMLGRYPQIPAAPGGDA